MFSFFKKSPTRHGLLGISFSADGIALSHIVPSKPLPTLDLCAFVPCSVEDYPSKLTAAVKRLGLGGARCVLVMEPGTYSILQVEIPEVPRDELASAIRWKVKDLLDFHIDDAVIDVFDMPVNEQRGRAPMAYAVAARAPVIQARVNLLTEAGLNIEAIDIAELALRNLITSYQEDAQGVAMIYLNHQFGEIILTRQGDLYLARQFSMGLDYLNQNSSAEAQQHFVDSLALELQRSLDYYESYFGQPPITSILIAPDMIDLNPLYANLEENLRIKCLGLELDKALALHKDLAQSEVDRCILAISGALRGESITS